mgnify:CR=1 FL=1
MEGTGDDSLVPFWQVTVTNLKQHKKMIIFDQLRISDDGKRLYITVHVNTADCFSSIYLDEIYITTGERVMEATNADSIPQDYIYKKVIDGNQKEISLCLSASDFLRNWEEDASTMVFKESEMSSSLFFVYVRCKNMGTPDPCFECLPCSLQEMTTVGVTFDENLLYQQVMDYTKQLADDCSIPQGFTDFILLWNAFKAAVNTEHFVPAVKYYNMLFDNGNVGTGSLVMNVQRRCGCHG